MYRQEIFENGAGMGQIRTHKDLFRTDCVVRQ